MQVTYFGHSAIQLSVGDHIVLVDPFLTDNSLSDVDPASLTPSHILLTHAHGDHVGDTEAIAKESGAVVVSSPEIAGYYRARGLKSHGMNIGGSFDFPFGNVTFTPAWHSSSFPDGTYGGMPMGVIVEAAGKRVYHAGDTALFSDMALLGRRGLDLALLPIGDNFTMGPEAAAEAAQLLQASLVVPIHYNTFPVIEQDPGAFLERLEAQGGTGRVLDPGGVLTLD